MKNLPILLLKACAPLILSYWRWDPEDTLAVRKIKEICTSQPPLQLPTGNYRLFVKTDASDNAWGGVLEWTEVAEDGKLNPPRKIAKYASGSWNETEKHWSTFDKERRAVVNSLEAFHFIYSF